MQRFLAIMQQRLLAGVIVRCESTEQRLKYPRSQSKDITFKAVITTGYESTRQEYTHCRRVEWLKRYSHFLEAMPPGSLNCPQN
ncbi:hypothetical protein TcWFU_005112 [Taenia crassiceps]|uniref:Uncharacterized protein n=1 Tax=Taenia crassiceps TaxID=6207 RepID=A0ABR4QDU9_9CEST